MKGIEDRAAGLVVPLFAARDAADWGIGEIGHLGPLAAWLASAGHRHLQILPVNEMPPGERSPYAAMSAFAIDAIYVSVGAIGDFVASGGEAALGAEVRQTIGRLRAAQGIDYDGVRAVKRRALAQAFAYFREREWGRDSPRAQEFRRFRSAAGDWLREYALFRVWQEQGSWRSWTEWDAPRRMRSAAALAEGYAVEAEAMLFHEYVQWQAWQQWGRARREMRAAGVALLGDLPFGVARNSVDVWAHQDEFLAEASLGAPPDAFNAAGQDWGLPPYRWEVMARRNFGWLRQRVAHAATQFDAFRIDHVVGFYRMYVIPPVGPVGFVPAEDAEQLALGERLLSIVLSAVPAGRVLGEDLGVVPDAVRASLARLGIPGYRVLRWEADGGVFRDPRQYPARSVATTGTHDTATLASWWSDELDESGRRALGGLPPFAALAPMETPWSVAVAEALLDGVYAAGSDLVLVPVQDTYGGRERVNTPATVGRGNWDYRLPWTIGELRGTTGAPLRDRLLALCRRHGR